MNICFLAGIITDVYEFKFIYNENISHKCIIKFKIRLPEDSQKFELIAFDEMAEEVIKNKFKFVHICAKFVEKYNIEVTDIYGEE
ncbi:MAG: hypothetical protein J6D03_10815 [Clostridia bacterium]|nr:hypothetical protein [Clostridia bacterium]